MKINFLCVFLALAFLTSCTKVNDKNPALLGKWQGTEWLVMDKPSAMDATKVHFEFREDGSYTAAFGDQSQSGVWRTEKDKLYAKEDGKQEIMIKMAKIEPTAIDFEMNRSGQKELLKLKKQ